jgi:hypothetical protein
MTESGELPARKTENRVRKGKRKGKKESERKKNGRTMVLASKLRRQTSTS